MAIRLRHVYIKARYEDAVDFLWQGQSHRIPLSQVYSVGMEIVPNTTGTLVIDDRWATKSILHHDYLANHEEDPT